MIFWTPWLQILKEILTKLKAPEKLKGLRGLRLFQGIMYISLYIYIYVYIYIYTHIYLICNVPGDSEDTPGGLIHLLAVPGSTLWGPPCGTYREVLSKVGKML